MTFKSAPWHLAVCMVHYFPQIRRVDYLLARQKETNFAPIILLLAYLMLLEQKCWDRLVVSLVGNKFYHQNYVIYFWLSTYWLIWRLKKYILYTSRYCTILEFQIGDTARKKLTRIKKSTKLSLFKVFHCRNLNINCLYA